LTGPGGPLPAAVLEALSKGNLIEAIKLLRGSGMGLKEAKDALDAHARGKPAPHAPTFSAASLGQSLPPDVLDALQKGRKIEAIRLMREQTGLGLKESKDAVDGYQQMYHPLDGLSPGQVGDTGSGIWWVIVLVLVCVLGYLVLRRLG
jgi:ribosomal protein L7/L12